MSRTTVSLIGKPNTKRFSIRVNPKDSWLFIVVDGSSPWSPCLNYHTNSREYITTMFGTKINLKKSSSGYLRKFMLQQFTTRHNPAIPEI